MTSFVAWRGRDRTPARNRVNCGPDNTMKTLSGQGIVLGGAHVVSRQGAPHDFTDSNAEFVAVI